MLPLSPSISLYNVFTLESSRCKMVLQVVSCMWFSFSCLFMARYQREEAKIQAWVNLQSAKAEAESRKLEVSHFLVQLILAFVPDTTLFYIFPSIFCLCFCTNTIFHELYFSLIRSLNWLYFTTWFWWERLLLTSIAKPVYTSKA